MMRHVSILPLLRFLILASLAAVLAVPANGAKSIEQFGITWTFAGDYPTGRFANGDHWVVGPIAIVSIDPPSETNGERTINGSMVNPPVGKTQGYDSAAYGAGRENYDPALNVALGVSPENPLILPPGRSLVSTISEPESGHRPQLRSAAILTVLDSPAPAGSFRPPPTGRDKTLRWKVDQMDLSVLRSLRRVRGAPNLRRLAARFERPWLEQNPGWTGRYLHPSENQPDYGRDMAALLGDALLSLQLDYRERAKRPLLIRLVQYGIDVYGAAQAGARWMNDGGHNHGRKMPLLLAGSVLGDPEMLAYANGTASPIFQEDQQTWYVSSEDVGRPLHDGDGRRRDAYEEEDVGVPEWGEKHGTDPARDGRNWDVRYRTIVGGSILGHALTARLMGAEETWNWPAFFDYYDRYWRTEAGRKSAPSGVSGFTRAMWSRYRGTVAAGVGDRTEKNRPGTLAAMSDARPREPEPKSRRER